MLCFPLVFRPPIQARTSTVMNRLIIFAACSLLLSGCSLQPLRDGYPAPVSDRNQSSTEVKRLRDQARMLRYRGRHGEALARLDQALRLQPDNPALKEERQLSLETWHSHKARLSDRLLISEIEAAQTQTPLLETLSRANPDDTELRQRLDRARQQLAGAHAGLYRCGQRHSKNRPELAKRCLKLDLQLSQRANSRILLARLEKSGHNRQIGSTKPDRRLAAIHAQTKTASDKPEKPHPSVLKAEQLIRDGKYFGAIRQLSKLEQNGQADTYALQLLKQAQDQLHSISQSMLQAGDEMLQQGKPREALALWEAVLNLDPHNQTARRKIELALHQLGERQSNQEPDS